MLLEERLELLEKLGNYILEEKDDWRQEKERAYQQNPWFISQFIDIASKNIAENYLQKEALKQLADENHIPATQDHPRKVGIVMAGNIPLVGFHDLLCVFLSGHIAVIKLSSKDEVLVKHLAGKLIEWNANAAGFLVFAQQLKGCDAYIATGSNNSSRYFEYYFAKYPHIIRKNRTSAAIITGEESSEQLDRLSDDIMLYFGLGCRNVTHIFVPREYDFIPLLEALKKFDWLMDHHKYRHNYDYQLALVMMNNRFYMTNGSVILTENPSLFSAISVVHYSYYDSVEQVQPQLDSDSANLQCIVGSEFIPFGKAQTPGLCDYADGENTMQFLMKL